MVAITTELLGGEFPVGVNGPLDDARQHFQPTVGAVQPRVQVKGHVAEVIDEGRRGRVEVSEIQALVAFDANRQQAPLRLVQLTEVRVVRVRDIDQGARTVVGPTVVRAHECLGISRFRAAHSHAPVAADVQEGLDRPVSLARDDDRIPAHVRRVEVSRLLDHGVVRKEEPGAPEHLLEFGVEDLLADKDLGGDETFLLINEGAKFGRVKRHGDPPCEGTRIVARRCIDGVCSYQPETARHAPSSLLIGLSWIVAIRFGL